MKNLKYPSLIQWLDQLKIWSADAAKGSGLVGYRLNGAATSKNIQIRDPSGDLKNMPFVSVALIKVEHGWDEKNSGQVNDEAHTYTSIGGSNMVKAPVEILERLTFSLDVYSNIYRDVVAISDSLHRYFIPKNRLFFTYESAEKEVFTKCGDITYTAVEGDKEKLYEYFMASMDRELSTLTTNIESETITGAVKSVVVSITEELGDETSDSITKTI